MGLTHSVDADSDCRQRTSTADLSFCYFSNPPFRLLFHLNVSRCTGVCPCGIFRGTWIVVPRGGHACEAPRVVLRGFVVLPLENNTMSSISPSPQGEVGQSHSSRARDVCMDARRVLNNAAMTHDPTATMQSMLTGTHLV